MKHWSALKTGPIPGIVQSGSVPGMTRDERLTPGLERRFGPDHQDVGMYPVPVLTRQRRAPNP